MTNLKYTWDEYKAFLKRNRIKLTTCFNGDVKSYSEYRKYIGKTYLIVEKSDYSQSFYVPEDKQNEIVFKWGKFKVTHYYDRSEKMPESIDFLQEALDWYGYLKVGGATA